jgi:purine-binding chemotaxis protein CheW
MATDVKKHMLLRCGDYALAIDIEHVFTTVPQVAPTPSPVDSEVCKGVTRYNGRFVPVIDPLTILGLYPLSDDQLGPGVVLRFPNGYVVLGITALLDIVDISTDQMLSLPDSSFRRPDLLLGVAQLAGVDQCLVIDGDRLLAEADVRTYSEINTDDPSSNDGSDGLLSAITSRTTARTNSTEERAPQLVYSLGVDVATPLDRVQEIVPVPGELVRAPGNGCVLGTTVHRHRVVPVVDLPALLGISPASATAGRDDRGSASCLLLVADNDDHVAFRVEALRTIESLSWRDPDQKSHAESTHDFLHQSPVVQVGNSSQLLPQLDLVRLLRLFVDGQSASAQSASVQLG